MRKEKLVGRLLALRRKLKDHAHAAWSHAEHTMTEAQTALDDKTAYLQHLGARATRLSTHKATDLLENAEHLDRARRCREEAAARAAEASEAAEAARVVAVQAAKEVKVMERVEAQLRSARVLAVDTAEQRLTDEVAATRGRRSSR